MLGAAAGVRFPASIVALLPLALILSFGGCAQIGGASQAISGSESIDRAPDLSSGLAVPPIPDFPTRQQRDAYVEALMIHSDDLCAPYKDKLIALSRNQRLTTDLLHTALSGAATLVSSLAAANILAGAGTTIAGLGGAVSADTLNQQAGEILASAIQTARDNQANQIELNLRDMDEDQYPKNRAVRDVNTYHHMCGLETAFASIRSSLKTASPDAGSTPQAAQGGQTNTGQAAATFVAPPPPAPPPPPPRIVRSLSATPSLTAARDELNLVLGLKPLVRTLAKQRQPIFKQCVKDVTKADPTSLTEWIRTSDSATLATVTKCVKDRVQGG